MAKFNKEDQIKINCIYGDLSDLLYELQSNKLDEESLYQYISSMLIDAGVDSRIVVNVLEKGRFGDTGKEVALGIKINEGW
jgi:hypothetical protein